MSSQVTLTRICSPSYSFSSSCFCYSLFSCTLFLLCTPISFPSYSGFCFFHILFFPFDTLFVFFFLFLFPPLTFLSSSFSAFDVCPPPRFIFLILLSSLLLLFPFLHLHLLLLLLFSLFPFLSLIFLFLILLLLTALIRSFLTLYFFPLLLLFTFIHPTSQ